jgi:phosphatidyl-myo-inositol dimannoside synthase
MKILYLTPGCFDKGGISRYNRYQINALRELYGNDQVRVLSLAPPRRGDFEDPFSVHWHGDGVQLGSKVRFSLQSLKEALAWRPHVILATHVNLSGLSVLAARASKSICILNTYGLEVWSGLTKDANWGLKNSDYVISDCHYTARYLEGEKFRVQNSVEVIWDCVDLDRFHSKVTIPDDLLSKYGLPDPHKHKLIVSLGRISKGAAHKGYDRLIQAFSLFHLKHPEARLVIAGKGDLTDALKLLARDCGVFDKVIFTGMVDEKDLPAIYRLAYVFSLVSDRGKGRGEGIPLTPLEAMACRVPIIVGNQDGSQEAVIGEANGFTIDPFDIETHAQRLVELIVNHTMREEKAENALLMAHKHFSYLHFKIKHKELLSRVVPAN